ncbi:hypothetical protein Tco_1499474 [Tanacetum coccineum]
MNGLMVTGTNDPEPGDYDVNYYYCILHEQTDDELTVAEIKQMEADDQAIQTILLGLPEDIYAAVDSCETAQEILRFSDNRRMAAGIFNSVCLILLKEKARNPLQAEDLDLMVLLQQILSEIEDHQTDILMAN